MSSPDFSRPSPVDGYYDVYLSFRGKDDNRIGLPDYLCSSLRRSGVHTFIHADPTIGEISHYNVFRVIEKSRIAILFYSIEYCTSEYCLNELDIILQRKANDKKLLLFPIFYQVSISELIHLSRKIVQELDKHIPEYGKTTVEKWKVAVNHLGRISGLPYRENDSRSEQDFAEEVLARVKKMLPAAGCHPVSYEYSVFLSFRGKDTRESFTSTLCHTLSKVHKVKTFMDVIFEKGNKLEELLKMVEKSRFSIVVFSENFAESEWCLKELAKIIKERDQRGHQVVPVFYKVDESEVRNQDKGKTKEHMDKHYNKYGKDSEMVKSWSNALTQLGNSSGYTYRSGRGIFEVELATEIAQDILTRLHGGKSGEQQSSSKLRDIISTV